MEPEKKENINPAFFLDISSCFFTPNKKEDKNKLPIIDSVADLISSKTFVTKRPVPSSVSPIKPDTKKPKKNDIF